MTTPVFLTVDAALLWRHHADRLDLAAITERSIDPAGVGLAFQLARLARHGLKATFFVDPMPALVFGLDSVRRVVDRIIAAGQEVQLQLHPVWTGAGIAALSDYGATEQHDLIAGARDLLIAAGAPVPIAFRAGGYAANDDTLRALAELGFIYDSSCNGGDPAMRGAVTLAPRQIAPVTHCGVTEVPVSLIEEHEDTLRALRIPDVSAGEIGAALDHAEAHDHVAVTIACDTAALANHIATRANAIHVSRFEALCAMLAARRDTLPTCWFGDRPALRLDQDDMPLEPHPLRTGWRNAEQRLSLVVEERAA